ncbi:MAG: lipoate--protein ligase [Bacteroidales bacterium]|nr:lipoate--protein ligase [Bacteroidales bacterium]
MLCIQNKNTDPYFNLAAEEYILKNFQDDCFMLYQNENSIIVGKHQNTLSEINLDFVNENDIKVVRRISGGGTVFHDLGNLNFSFFMSGEDGKLVNFKKYTRPILEFIQNSGIEAEFGKRNDLVIDGKKISGNAEHIWKKKTLHHGTILYSSELSHLSSALKVNPLKFADKSVKSVRSRVTNLCDYLPVKMDISVFSEKLMTHIMEKYSVGELYDFSERDIKEIKALKNKKFVSWEWNFGYSPNYNFKKTVKVNFGNLSVNLKTIKGVISEIEFSSEFIQKDNLREIEGVLHGKKHDRDIIKAFLENYMKDNNLNGIAIDEMLKALF